MGIAAIEDFLITTTRAEFGKSLKTVDHLPGEWGSDALRRMVLMTPAVFFAYLGGKADTQRVKKERSVWQVYVFTGSAGDEKLRRRGSVLAAGAYQLVDTVKGLLDELPVPGEDALKYVRTENLFDDFLHANGLTAYRISFELLIGVSDRDASQAALGDFKTLYTTLDTQPSGGADDGTTRTNLPQE